MLFFFLKKKEDMNFKFRDLKSELKIIQEEMRNNLTKLTVKTNDTMNCLKKNQKKYVKKIKYIKYKI